MIELNNSYLIGTGTNRACYQHPNDNNKCIKVTISGDFSESNTEKKYYTFLKNNDASFDFIAKYYGVIETNMGEGLIFELISDNNDDVSKPLSVYFYKNDFPKEVDTLVEKLKKLKEYLINEKIIVKDLSFANILYQKSKNRLVVIDGIMNNEFIPVSTYINYFTTRKINRRWDLFMKKLKKKYPNVFDKYCKLK